MNNHNPAASRRAGKTTAKVMAARVIDVRGMSDQAVSQACAKLMQSDEALNQKYRRYVFGHTAQVKSMSQPAYRGMDKSKGRSLDY